MTPKSENIYSILPPIWPQNDKIKNRQRSRKGELLLFFFLEFSHIKHSTYKKMRNKCGFLEKSFTIWRYKQSIGLKLFFFKKQYNKYIPTFWTTKCSINAKNQKRQNGEKQLNRVIPARLVHRPVNSCSSWWVRGSASSGPRASSLSRLGFMIIRFDTDLCAVNRAGHPRARVPTSRIPAVKFKLKARAAITMRGVPRG